jgi:hypothetical protein
MVARTKKASKKTLITVTRLPSRDGWSGDSINVDISSEITVDELQSVVNIISFLRKGEKCMLGVGCDETEK